MFRKMKRNVRLRRTGGSPDASSGGDDDNDIDSGKTENGADVVKVVDMKNRKLKSKTKVGIQKSNPLALEEEKKPTATALLSFEDELDSADGGQVFQVKKSSQSRKLMKMKAKTKPKGDEDDSEEENTTSSRNFLKSSKENESISGRKHDGRTLSKKSSTTTSVRKDKDEGSKKKNRGSSWILSGKEAEALHMEEEDDEDDYGEDQEEDKDPFKRLLQSGVIPDAAAIHAARKKREALRAGGAAAGNKDSDHSSKNFIPLSGRGDERRGRRRHHLADEDDDSEEDGRINFAGVRSEAAEKRQQMEGMVDDLAGMKTAGTAEKGNGHLQGRHVVPNFDDEDGWEQQQIRKAMKSTQIANVIGNTQSPFLTANDSTGLLGTQSSVSTFDCGGNISTPNDEVTTMPKNLLLNKPTAYDLRGIRDRLKERIESMKEVHRRHENDLDRAVDDLVNCQREVNELTKAVPRLDEKHQYYQDLRGYVTDLVECFDEKLVNIKYLEEKYYKSKADVCKKLMERRREDVRDQMKELSAALKGATINAGLQIMDSQAVAPEEESRQRRAAEREGRRRRRQQQRKASSQGATFAARHADGMSSDDELSTLDQATLGRMRQDVENQARLVLADVVEDFSTLEGVCERLEDWKINDPQSYSDAFVSICVPKIVSPLIRLQLLFWNPLGEHSDLESMSWYKRLAIYGVKRGDDDESEKEPGSVVSTGSTRTTIESDVDRKLLSLVLEKVVLAKVANMVKHLYDPLSTTQTLKIAGLIERMVGRYPTVTGESRQVRDLLENVKAKLKTAIDADVYIPVGYSKQLLENTSGGHHAFLQRQFWGAFKLFRNVLAWQGILSDKLVAEMAINLILNRYLVIGLGVIPDPLDVVNKSRHILGAVPKSWLGSEYVYKLGLSRFAKFLLTFGESKPLAADTSTVREVVRLLKVMGAEDEAGALERLRLNRT